MRDLANLLVGMFGLELTGQAPTRANRRLVFIAKPRNVSLTFII
jgi:hypothetical protein